MSNKSLVGSEAYLANMDSPTSNPQRLKAQSRQLFIGLQQSHGTTESTITVVTNLQDHNSVTKPSASLYETGFCFTCNEGMGMMQ